MKRFLALCLVSVTLFSTCAFGADATRFVCNGKEAAITATAIFRDGYTYLPVAQVCKALGYHVIEKSSNNSVTAEVRGESGYFSVFLGKPSGRMNGQDIELGKAPFSENGVIYVSLALIEEQLGVKVNYDSSKNTVYINSAGEGKITSTVGQAPVAAPSPSTGNSSSTANTSSSSSGYRTYSQSRHVLDFTSVTGIAGTKDEMRVNTYHYPNVSESSLKKYCDALKAAGFTEGKSAVKTGYGMTLVQLPFAYITKNNGMAIESSLIITYDTDFPTTVDISFNIEGQSLIDANEEIYGG